MSNSRPPRCRIARHRVRDSICPEYPDVNCVSIRFALPGIQEQFGDKLGDQRRVFSLGALIPFPISGFQSCEDLPRDLFHKRVFFCLPVRSGLRRIKPLPLKNLAGSADRD
jgi:hypothetical protein